MADANALENMGAWGKRILAWSNKKRPNEIFLCFNLAYLIVALAGFVIVVVSLDYRRQDFEKLSMISTTVPPQPCGLPTPNAVYLMQALGRATYTVDLMADYGSWMSYLEKGFCSHKSHAYGLEYKYADDQAIVVQSVAAILDKSSLMPTSDSIDVDAMEGAFCGPLVKYEDDTYGDYKERITRAYIAAMPAIYKYVKSFKRRDGQPFTTSVTSGSTQQFNNWLCGFSSGNDCYGSGINGVSSEFTWDTTETGNPWHDDFDPDSGCLGMADPFRVSTCGTYVNPADPNGYLRSHRSHHVHFMLHKAAGNVGLMVSADATTVFPPVSEMIYVLLALSWISHVDRTHGIGACFGNVDSYSPFTTKRSARDFCAQDVFPSNSIQNGVSPPSVDASATTEPYTWLSFDIDETIDGRQFQNEATRTGMTYSRYGNGIISKCHQCPANDLNLQTTCTDEMSDLIRRTDYVVDESTGTYEMMLDVCATSMEFGLFDQRRLFGIPDTTGEFVDRNRPPAPIGDWLLTGPFVLNPFWLYPLQDDAGNIKEVFRSSTARLKLFAAYRLAASAFWGSMAATIFGYFIARALVPFTIVTVFRFFNLSADQLTGVTEVMKRPRWAVTLYIAIFAALATGYWIIWLDPAVQSDYYTTDSCNRWLSTRDESPAGAFVTTWNKRKWTQVGEYVVGAILIVIAAMPIVYLQVASLFQRAEVKEESKTWRVAVRSNCMTLRAVPALVIIVMMIFLAAQSGDAYLQELEANPEAVGDTTDLEKWTDMVSKDCAMIVWVSFFLGFATAFAQTRWAVQKLKDIIANFWVIVQIGTVFAPIITLISFVPGEIEWAINCASASVNDEVSCTDEYAGGRYGLYVAIFLSTVGFLAIDLYELQQFCRARFGKKNSNTTSDTAKERTRRGGITPDVAKGIAKVQSENFKKQAAVAQASLNKVRSAARGLPGAFKAGLGRFKAWGADDIRGSLTEDDVSRALLGGAYSRPQTPDSFPAANTRSQARATELPRIHLQI